MQLTTLSPVQKIEHNNWILHFQTKHNFRAIDSSNKEVPFASKFFENMNISERSTKPENYLLGTYPIDMRTKNHNKSPTLRQSFSKEEGKWQAKHNKLGINHHGIPTLSSSFILEQVPNINNNTLTISFPKADEHLTKTFELRK